MVTPLHHDLEFRLGRTKVAEVMHRGVLTCPTDAPLTAVAQLMATERVHCVVVYDERQGEGDVGSLWGIVSDLDLAEAVTAGGIEERSAGDAAVTPVLMVSSTETLVRAAQLMSENGAGHLVVVDPLTGHPVGVLSTLDLARFVGAPAQ